MKKILALLLAALMAFSLSAFAEESIDLEQLFVVDNSVETLLKHYDSICYENLENGVLVSVDYADSQIGYYQDFEDEYAHITAENGIYCWAPDTVFSSDLSNDYYLNLFIDNSYMQESWYWYDDSNWIADDESVLEFEDRGDTLYLKTEFSYIYDDAQYSGTAIYTIDAQTHAILEAVQLATDESGVTTEHKYICKYNAEIPAKALELLERANPAAENARTSTLIIDPGTDKEKTLRSTITKGDTFALNLPEEYGVFLDAEGTHPAEKGGDYGDDSTLYLLPISE